MRIKSLAAAFAIPFAHAAAAAASPPPLMAPTGPWNVEFADKMCLLSRPYGKDGATQLMLKPDIVGSGMEIIVSNTAASASSPEIGNAGVTVAGRKLSFDPIFYAYSTGKARLVRVAIPDNKIELSALRETLSFNANSEGRYAFSIPGIELARPMLADCLSELRAAYKISDADIGKVATRPDGSNVRLFTFDDYPAEALRRGQSGMVGVLFWVEPNGRVSTCEVIESTASPVLEQATCNMVKGRARFKPARDAANNAIRAPGFTRIRWMLPSS